MAGLLVGGTLTPRLEPQSLASLDGHNGFAIAGAVYQGFLGNAVAAAGDINGDGLGDIVVGVYDYGLAGAAYVVFGAADWSETPVLEDGDLDGSNGFRLIGGGTTAWTGQSVAGAGDFDGDGYDDIVIGSPRADLGTKTDAGVAYVVFGKTQWTGTPSIDLGSLSGGGVLRLDGSRAGDQAGSAVAGAGDVNGDGYDDLIVGAPGADRGARDDAGAAYVVFGGPDRASTPRLALAALDGSNGFRLEGIDAGDQAGTGVAIVGDSNGDGLADLAVGAPGATVGGASEAGEAYLVFGAAAFPAAVGLAGLDGSNGTRLYGEAAAERCTGFAVAGAGDMNGDGRADVAVGAPQNHGAGAAYVVFGAVSLPAAVNLTVLNGTNGFAIAGHTGEAGYTLAGAGDTNGDGIDDLIVGAPFYPGYESRGAAYLFYGKPDWSVTPSLDVTSLAGSDGRQLNGADSGSLAGNGVGGNVDVNGDGFMDVLVGAPGFDTRDGAAYVVFGTAPPRCRGREATVFGGNGADTLTGTSGDDVIAGLGGNDIIDGGGGNDTICGEAGDDQITGGPGNDVIDGGEGTDWASFGTATGPGDRFPVHPEGHRAGHRHPGRHREPPRLPVRRHLDRQRTSEQPSGQRRGRCRSRPGGQRRARGWPGVRHGGLHRVAGQGHGGSALDVAGGGAGIDFISGFERVIGSAYGDALYGDGAANTLSGMGGNDVLGGRDGDDSLDGGAGDGYR